VRIDRIGRHPQPIPALAQAIEQRHIRNIDQSGRRCPGRCRSQPAFAQGVGQDHPQQVNGAGKYARPQERFRFPGAGIDRCGPAQPVNHLTPVSIHQ